MTSKCKICGSEDLVKLSSQNAKMCSECGTEEAWPLEEGQQPLVGSHRQKSGTPVKVDSPAWDLMEEGSRTVIHAGVNELVTQAEREALNDVALEQLIGKPEEHQQPSHPMQPIVFDDKKVVRFKQNAIIDWLYRNGRVDMNELAYGNFPEEDRMQFAQLLGYSVSGYGTLSYVSEASRDRADQIAEAMAMGELLSAAELPLQAGKTQFDPIFMAIEVLGKSSHLSIMKRIELLTDHKRDLFGHQLDRLLQRIAPDDSMFSNYQAELRSLSNTIVATHTLYEKGDEGCPEQILDSNGDVVLGLCKHCGAGESELSQQICTGPKFLDEKLLTDPNSKTSLLFQAYCDNLGIARDALIPSYQILEKGEQVYTGPIPIPDPDYIRRSYRFGDVCHEDYHSLTMVLQRAHDQAAYGKGKDRHAKGQPFHEQRMQTISRLLDSEDGMAYQVLKKVTEGLDLPTTERKVAELLGAINYLAGIVIFLEAKDRDNGVTVVAGTV